MTEEPSPSSPAAAVETGTAANTAAMGFRTLGGIAFLACPVLAGLLGRSPALLLAFIFVLVILKPISGRVLWASNVREKGAGVLAPMLLATLMVQCILAAVLFLLGRAAGAVVGYGKPSEVLEPFDGTLVIATFLLGLILGELRKDG